MATTVAAKKRLLDGSWDFDYLFFSESDQILISRELQLMYDHLKKFPGLVSLCCLCVISREMCGDIFMYMYRTLCISIALPNRWHISDNDKKEIISCDIMYR